MPEWLLVAVGILIGSALIAGGMWWAFMGEFRSSRLPRPIEQNDDNTFTSGADSGSSHHSEGDSGGHSGF